MKNGIEEILKIEKEAREIIDDAQNKSEKIREEAEKEAKKIVMNAKKEAESIIDGYKSQLSKVQKKEEKNVEEKVTNLKGNRIKHYKNVKEELLAELIAFSLVRE